jgi:organic hydroperoxide reductase OsmC/OhrA
MAVEHYYNVSVDWTEGRIGMMKSPELELSIEVATPPQFPKGIENVWSPEHLFVAAINSCLMTTFLAIAENFKLEFSGFTSKAVGKLEVIDGKYVISEVTLKPMVTVLRAEEKEMALKVLLKSEAACLISNSVRSRIVFEPDVRVVVPELSTVEGQ